MTNFLIGLFSFLLFGLAGLGIMLSENDLLQMCGRGCAVNAIFVLLFGNAIGKIVAGTLSILLGIWLLWFAWYGNPRKKDYYTD